jgi:hypothetical protein
MDGFLPRVLRWIAILTIVIGTVGAISFITLTLLRIFHSPWVGSRVPRADRYIAFALALASILSAVGGYGLLRWKPWGRTLLLVWAPLSMSARLATSLYWLVPYASVRAATTQPAGAPMAFIGLMVVMELLSHYAFPLLVMAVLLQPDVRKLWANRTRGGFDVVPFASVMNR